MKKMLYFLAGLITGVVACFAWLLKQAENFSFSSEEEFLRRIYKTETTEEEDFSDIDVESYLPDISKWGLYSNAEPNSSIIPDLTIRGTFSYTVPVSEDDEVTKPINISPHSEEE